MTVGILGPQALPIIMIKPKEGFYDFENKYPFLNPQAGGGAEHHCPAPLPEKVTRLIQEIALAAHGALGLEVYSRVDFILSRDGEPYVLEINTIPGMTEASLLPEAAAVAGISYGELCERIIELSLARIQRRKYSAHETKARPRQARNQRVSSRKQRKQQHLLDVKVRSRAANRQRNRQRAGVVQRLFPVCRGAWAASWYGGREALRRFFWQNPDYNLAEVAIHTDGSLTREQIIAGDGHPRGEEYFRHQSLRGAQGPDGAAAGRARGDRAHPAEQDRRSTSPSASRWPGSPAKDDDDPSADPGAFLIDRDGIADARQEPGAGILPPAGHLRAGRWIITRRARRSICPRCSAALELIRLTGENPARYQVRSIDVSKGYCMIVTDERHAKITFPLENIAAQLDRLAAAVREYRQQQARNPDRESHGAAQCSGDLRAAARSGAGCRRTRRRGIAVAGAGRRPTPTSFASRREDLRHEDGAEVAPGHRHKAAQFVQRRDMRNAHSDAR